MGVRSAVSTEDRLSAGLKTCTARVICVELAARDRSIDPALPTAATLGTRMVRLAVKPAVTCCSRRPGFWLGFGLGVTWFSWRTALAE